MYKLHLILKYLRKRRIAWVSLVAVMLCTAMVLVVISVMGGWLRMFRQTNHALIGDLIVHRYSLDGFGHYQEMMQDIQKLPEVKAVSPEIHTYALLNIANQLRTGVQVVGYDIQTIGQVNGFVSSLHWQPATLEEKAKEFDRNASALAARVPEDAEMLRGNAQAMRNKAAAFPSWDKPMAGQEYRDLLPNSHVDVSTWPGIVVGSGVIGLRPDENGVIERPDFIYRKWVRLTVLNVSESQDTLADTRVTRSYWLMDDSKTGVFQVDQNMVYVPFDLLQKDLNMDARPYTDRRTGEQKTTFARCNQLLISLRDGYDMNAVQPKIAKIVDDLEQKYGDLNFPDDVIKTQTWEEKQADFLAAVEHEKVLLVILFAIISVVAVFLIFCIFFMIVVEKTRDIGIIKSVGATSAGVAGIFLGYGLTIGIIGGAAGLLLGYLVVHNINWLHAWLARELGVKIWDAKTYVFDTIPNTMELRDVVVIVTVAILSSVIGAIVPAVRAARMNPVEALRWE